MLDDRAVTQPGMDRYYRLWNQRSNRFGWECIPVPPTRMSQCRRATVTYPGCPGMDRRRHTRPHLRAGPRVRGTAPAGGVAVQGRGRTRRLHGFDLIVPGAVCCRPSSAASARACARRCTELTLPSRRKSPRHLEGIARIAPRLAAVPTDPGFVLHEITLQRLRALLARHMRRSNLVSRLYGPLSCHGEIAWLPRAHRYRRGDGITAVVLRPY